MIKCRRVELDEFHILYGSFGAVDHRYAVACRYRRVGCGGVYLSYSAGGHYRHFRQESVYFVCGKVEYVCAVAGYVGRAPCDNLPQMVLCYYLNGKMVLENVDIRM